MSRSGETLTRVWIANGVGVWCLWPLSLLFRFGAWVKNALYDLGVQRSVPLGLPTISVGNLSVGGTGKTPVSAWVARELAARGCRPAILLRGYGDDEVLVHRTLNPGVPVIADANRVRGAAAARSQGATVLVLDDAFQHRRAARDVDLVLVATEQGGSRHVLPAGPFREGRGALRRAHAVVVTRKSAPLAGAEGAAAYWRGFPDAPPAAIVALAPIDLRLVHPEAGSDAVNQRPLSSVAGVPVLAISGIGVPDAFEAQLAASGATVHRAAFGDHHAYTEAEARVLAERAITFHATPVCTLKDAVKLGPLWPRQAPALWYLSQTVVVERGADMLSGLLDRLATAARSVVSSVAPTLKP